jgi:type III pantothenate kinase
MKNPGRLLLDAGNTRLKWVVVEGGDWREQGSANYTDLSALARALEAGVDCYVASVAGEQREQQINALLASFAITPRWLAAEAHQLGVRNSYADPLQLGVDRWMGLLAARRRTQAPTLVVSVGTAMTVDALSGDGVFLGGLIVPGIAMMQQSLRHGTSRVAEVSGAWQAFPRSTADGVHSGILAALCGAIRSQHRRLAEAAAKSPHCFITGGDAEKLLPHLELAVEQVPTLVLEGVDCVVREGRAA